MHPLALLILAGSSPALDQGGDRAWTFLSCTPDGVEQGLRNILDKHLGGLWPIHKREIVLDGDYRRTLNPDLVIGKAFAVGDVKYKLTLTGEIGRSDLYRVTAFATGYGVARAIIVTFDRGEGGERVEVGSIHVKALNWDIEESRPEVAASRLSEHVRRWLAIGTGV